MFISIRYSKNLHHLNYLFDLVSISHFAPIIHQNVFTHFFFLTSLQLYTFSPFKGLFVVLLLHTKKIQFSSAVIQNCSCSISDSISLLRYNIKKKSDSCMIQRIRIAIFAPVCCGVHSAMQIAFSSASWEK